MVEDQDTELNKNCKYESLWRIDIDKQYLALVSQIYPNKSRCIWIYPRCIRIHPECIRMYPDITGCVPDISEYIPDIWIYLDISMSGYIWIYLDISGILRLGGSQGLNLDHGNLVSTNSWEPLLFNMAQKHFSE
jgi:hypothetical protein